MLKVCDVNKLIVPVFENNDNLFYCLNKIDVIYTAQHTITPNHCIKCQNYTLYP